ncbi:hypothetical protein BCR41DRAFT_358279 [Lobosporangium transversale]|uniref:Uncharacterized protein n=1 Tax=Lobosporangium transversale TaxID=64571 RepID=A0A1Y2GHZ4_9FUNG|nr:hypothetical protein BCR41DRAFT_358279 [Lobosporangium transversale]ORZ09675.1 hypothetical protein BCR41DRAFT_358279 [Lobosporangium transversale]|eukprot:XP_021878945.1 hypothetical protein BCR41DRAFT_358279 [Lobosporangium transversale]
MVHIAWTVKLLVICGNGAVTDALVVLLPTVFFGSCSVARGTKQRSNPMIIGKSFETLVTTAFSVSPSLAVLANALRAARDQVLALALP